MTDSEPRFESFDVIDGVILQILAEDPRQPYSEITDWIERKGYKRV